MKAISQLLSKNISLIFIACLTLGLAPFIPEPHIWGKIKWIIGGAKGMQLIDYWDTFIHSAPWILLVAAILSKIRQKNSTI